MSEVKRVCSYTYSKVTPDQHLVAVPMGDIDIQKG